MSWTSLTPFLPFIRIALIALLVLAVAYQVVVYRKEGLGSFKKRRAKWSIAFLLLLLLVNIWVLGGASSSYRPKDSIQVRNPLAEQAAKRVSEGQSVEIPASSAEKPDWNKARDNFRDLTDEEQADFENKTSKP